MIEAINSIPPDMRIGALVIGVTILIAVVGVAIAIGKV